MIYHISCDVLFIITVNPPVVMTHPVSRIIAVTRNDYNLSLSCKGKGSNLKYLWQRLSGSIPNNTQGVNTFTLKFSMLSPDNSGKYRCKVFNESGFGYSNYATLTVYG